MNLNSLESALLSYYDEFPFHQHPLWKGILSSSFSLPQVLRAEVQHYLRTKAGQKLRHLAMLQSQSLDPRVFEALLKTYMEECTSDATGPSHLDLIGRLLTMGGVSQTQIDSTEMTPGNLAAISIYKEISTRGAGCHLLGAGAVEHYYSELAPKIFDAYVTKYGMSPEQAETYRLHGPMDKEHGSRAFSVLKAAVNAHGLDAVKRSVRDAFVATSLHYDGMLQAAVENNIYWDGRS